MNTESVHKEQPLLNEDLLKYAMLLAEQGKFYDEIRSTLAAKGHSPEAIHKVIEEIKYPTPVIEDRESIIAEIISAYFWFLRGVALAVVIYSLKDTIDLGGGYFTAFGLMFYGTLKIGQIIFR